MSVLGIIVRSAGTAREWRTQTRRTNGTTVVGSTDPFMVDGIQLGMLNISGQVITLTAISVRVMQTVNSI